MTTLAPKDQLHFRQVALTMANNMHPDQNRTAGEVTEAAKKFYDFMANNTMSAQVVVQLPSPSGLPAAEAPLPTDTIDSAYCREADTEHLRELRRQRLFELDAVSNELKLRGVVPC
jgi:hypothetical protein